jgi:hypothetical protein
VRAYGRRKKKLIIAFHFQFSDPARWRCDECRRAGLEKKRGCGFLEQKAPERVVWARGRVSTTACPKSYITGESAAWLEEFYAWRALGRPDFREMSAREAQALMILENELAGEANRGEE